MVNLAFFASLAVLFPKSTVPLYDKSVPSGIAFASLLSSKSACVLTKLIPEITAKPNFTLVESLTKMFFICSVNLILYLSYS